MSLLLTSCAADDDSGFDAGPDAAPVDATVVLDGEFVPDSAHPDAAGDALSADAAPSGDASAMLCPGPCRPDEGRCSAIGACVLWSAEPACVGVGGPLPEGSPCESVDQCMSGLSCFRRELGGVCGRVCCAADPTSCSAARVCTGVGMLVDGTRTEGYGECRMTRPCDLFAATGCETDEACYVVEPGLTDCRPAGESGANEPCVEPNDCAPGFSCVGAFEPKCARNCRVGEPDACPADEGDCRAYVNSPDGAGLCSG